MYAGEVAGAFALSTRGAAVALFTAPVIESHPDDRQLRTPPDREAD